MVDAFDKPNHGNVSEVRVATDLGAKLVAGSGAIDGFKGDSYLSTVQTERPTIDWMIESKATIHKSMSIKKSWLDKVRTEAAGHAKTPALSISFVDDNGSNRDFNSDWVAIPATVFKELIGGSDG